MQRAAIGPILVGLYLSGPAGGAIASARPAEHTPPAKRGAAPRRAQAPRKAPASAAEREIERLRRGVERFDAADYAGAREALAPLRRSGLSNRDLALWLLASSEALMFPPQRKEALAHFRELSALPGTALRDVARARTADMLFELDRLAEARAAYREVLDRSAPNIERAVARFRLAEIAERQGDDQGAEQGFRAVFVEHPLHPLSDRALERLQALAARANRKAEITPGERLERARRLTADRAWQRALDELAGLPSDLSPALRDEADFQEGMTRFRMRRSYDVAAEKLLAVWPRLTGARQADALFHGARARSRADQDDRAIEGYKLLVEKFPHAKPAPEASFLIGWLDFNRGRYREALPGLEAAIRRYGSSGVVDNAHWYLGFSRWMLGDAAGALGEFEWLSKRSGALDGGKGRYWKGRALEKLGRVNDALVEWRRLAADYPFTYYALQARVRLREHGVKLDVFGRPEGQPAEATATAGPGTPDESLARDPDVVRVDELLRAGLRREAGQTLTRVHGALLKRYGVPRALPLLLDRYEKAEDFLHLHRLAERYAGIALRRDPRTDVGARAFWQRVYPLAYRRFVEKYGPTGGNPPYYLYTIMQKESAYNPHDVSYADAIGLLQMIPPTSRRVGERIGRPYTDDVLYDPEGNIQFGAWYIGHLLEKFKGQIALGAGSYNAGPRAMMRWIKQNGARPLDEFIELCAYTQTREYMKKVLAIYAHYEWLYGGRDYLPDEKIDVRYLNNDIDY